MERFALKIDSTALDKLHRLCRLCGIDHPQKQNILKSDRGLNDSDGEPSLCRKIRDCIGLKVTASDRMPQNVCVLCVDRVNDIYEYRLMCEATQVQTRKLLGLPELKKRVKAEDGECILGLESKKHKATNGKKTTTANKSAAAAGAPMVSIAVPSTSSSASTPSTSTPANNGRLDDDDDGTSLLVPLKTQPKLPPPPACSAAKRKRPQVSAAEALARSAGLPVLKLPKLEMTADGEVPKVWCRVCRSGQADQKALEQHMLTAHRPLSHRWGCASCTLTFDTMTAHREHHQWHTRTSTTYACRLCDKKMPKLAALTYHAGQCAAQRAAWSTCTPVADVKCAQCDRAFRTQNLYDWHGCFMRVNGQCPRCGRHFVRKQMLFRHTVKCDGAYTSSGSPVPPPSTTTTTAAPATATTAAEASPVMLAAPAAVAAMQEMPAAKRYVAAMKMEPETMLDVDEDDDYNHFNDDVGGHHHNDDSDSDGRATPETTSASESAAAGIHWSAIRVKKELHQRRATAAAAVAGAPASRPPPPDSDSDDDVIIVEAEPTNAIVIDDHQQNSPEKQQPQRVAPIILSGRTIKREPASEPTGTQKPAKQRRIKLEPASEPVRPQLPVQVKQEAMLRDEAEASEDDVYDGYGETDSVTGDGVVRRTATIASVKQERRDEADAGVGDGHHCRAAAGKTKAKATTTSVVVAAAPTLIARVKQEQGEATSVSTNVTAVGRSASIRIAPVKLEPVDEAELRDEADASEDDVYDGYNDCGNSSPAPAQLVQVKQEPGTAAVAPAAAAVQLLRVKTEPGLEKAAPDRPALRLKIFKQHGRHSASVVNSDGSTDAAAAAAAAAAATAARRHARLMAKIRQEVQARDKRQPSAAQILRIKAERVSPERHSRDTVVAPAMAAAVPQAPASSAMLVNPFARTSHVTASEEADPTEGGREQAAESETSCTAVQSPLPQPVEDVPGLSTGVADQISYDVVPDNSSGGAEPSETSVSEPTVDGTALPAEAADQIHTDGVPLQVPSTADNVPVMSTVAVAPSSSDVVDVVSSDVDGEPIQQADDVPMVSADEVADVVPVISTGGEEPVQSSPTDEVAAVRELSDVVASAAPVDVLPTVQADADTPDIVATAPDHNLLYQTSVEAKAVQTSTTHTEADNPQFFPVLSDVRTDTDVPTIDAHVSQELPPPAQSDVVALSVADEANAADRLLVDESIDSVLTAIVELNQILAEESADPHTLDADTQVVPRVEADTVDKPTESRPSAAAEVVAADEPEDFPPTDRTPALATGAHVATGHAAADVVGERLDDVRPAGEPDDIPVEPLDSAVRTAADAQSRTD